jgi:acyl carrier protein
MIEQRLRTKWAELLDVDLAEISAHSDFFYLGGNSMVLLGLHIFLTQEFNIDLPIPDLIENAVFSQMVELIHSRMSSVQTRVSPHSNV